MKKILGIIVGVVMSVGVLVSPVLCRQASALDSLTDEDCAILDCTIANGEEGEALKYILGIALNVLTFGVGTAAVVGFIISAYQYITARDNAGQVLKAKTRILHIVIGLVIYVLFWAVLYFLVPGGVGD